MRGGLLGRRDDVGEQDGGRDNVAFGRLVMTGQGSPREQKARQDRPQRLALGARAARQRRAPRELDPTDLRPRAARADPALQDLVDERRMWGQRIYAELFQHGVALPEGAIRSEGTRRWSRCAASSAASPPANPLAERWPRPTTGSARSPP
jgi:hypothetical protein